MLLLTVKRSMKVETINMGKGECFNLQGFRILSALCITTVLKPPRPCVLFIAYGRLSKK